uniref:FAD-binding PCMH-type domain-containing protein n=1 Tax=Psilocybe cubensis TaxID=181762 RepID=A0A8H7Y257_PSICU
MRATRRSSLTILWRVTICYILASIHPASGDLISELTSSGNITVLTPASQNYANASTAFNLRFTLNPAAVTFPTTPQQISTILSLTTKYNHQAVARSGGHSYIANGLGGKDGVVVVDMSNFRAVTVDPETNVASIGVGNRLGDVALALNTYGRALPHGTCPYVGLGGHSGHGGYGFTSRKWGLTLDTIVAIDVVLANGAILNGVSNSKFPDLFWALRGSSSSFGIVTTIHTNTFAAPPSTTVFSYRWDLNISEAVSATMAYQSYVVSPDFPQEMGSEIVLRAGSTQGRVSFRLTGGWYAPPEQYDAVIQPYLTQLPSPQTATVHNETYIGSVEFFGGLGRLNTTGIPDAHDTFYAKSLMIPESVPFSNESLTAFYTYLANDAFTANTNWFAEIELYGGTNSAINNVPFDATAFGHRDTMFTMQFYTSAIGGVPPFPVEGFGLLDDMVATIVDNNPRGREYGAYANYIDNRLEDWQLKYYASHYPKLRNIKRKYDPHDTFDFPLSIQE